MLQEVAPWSKFLGSLALWSLLQAVTWPTGVVWGLGKQMLSDAFLESGRVFPELWVGERQNILGWRTVVRWVAAVVSNTQGKAEEVWHS